MTPNLRKLAQYAEANFEAAQIVLADVAKFSGEGSLMVRWGRLVVANVDDRAADEKELPLWRTA